MSKVFRIALAAVQVSTKTKMEKTRAKNAAYILPVKPQTLKIARHVRPALIRRIKRAVRVVDRAVRVHRAAALVEFVKRVVLDNTGRVLWH